MDASKVQSESQRQQDQEDQPRLVLRGGGLLTDWLVLNAVAFFPSPPFLPVSFPLFYLVYSQSSFL